LGSLERAGLQAGNRACQLEQRTPPLGARDVEGQRQFDRLAIGKHRRVRLTGLGRSCLSPQGSRMSLGCDDLEHVAVVPGSLLAPAPEAGLGAPVSGDQVESDLTKESEVARSRPVTHAAVILAEGDVQHPMQRVASRPEEFHLRPLTERCGSLSAHTAPTKQPVGIRAVQ